MEFVQQSSSVLWTPTTYVVDTGVEYFDINYQYTDPCDILIDAFDGRNTTNISQKAIDRMVQLCKEDFKKDWLPALEKFANCQSKKEKPVRSSWSISRIKRWFIWFLVAAVSLVGVVSSIVGSTVVLNEKIDSVDAKVDVASIDIVQLRATVLNQTKIANDTSDALEKLNDEMSELVRKMEEFAVLSSDLSWTGTKVQISMMVSKNYLLNLIDACYNGRVDSVTLGRFLDLPSIRKIDPASTKIISIGRVSEDTINIQFITPQINEDTKIYKVFPFSHWTNLVVDPYPIRYAGPEFVLHNATNNCTKGISEPKSLSVYDSCRTPNYLDIELQNWEREPVTSELPVPRIYKTDSYSYISCMFYNISINNVTSPCPSHVMKLSILQEFNLLNHTHQVSIVYVNASSEIEPNTMIHFNSSSQSDSHAAVAALINRIRTLNKKMEFDSTLRFFDLLLDPSSNVLHFVSVISILFTILTCIIGICKKGATGHNESVTINNSFPQHSDNFMDHDSYESRRHDVNHQYERTIFMSPIRPLSRSGSFSCERYRPRRSNFSGRSKSFSSNYLAVSQNRIYPALTYGSEASGVEISEGC